MKTSKGFFPTQTASSHARVLLRPLVSLMLAFGMAGLALADARGLNHETPQLHTSDVIGYPGGSPSRLLCPDSAPYMVGVEGRFGSWIDALAPLCVGYNASGRWDRTVALVGELAGGTGGGPGSFACPMGSRITRFLATAYELDGGRHLHGVSFYCGGNGDAASEDYVATPWKDEADCDTCLFVAPDPHEISCQNGLIARGLQVFVSDQVNSVALICGLAPVRAKYLGRVQSDNPDAPLPSLCEAAASARARNSPAAPSLEAQCQASKGPPVALGRVITTDVNITPTPMPTLCEAAVSARARNSPAAPSLEKQCAEYKAAHPVPD